MAQHDWITRFAGLEALEAPARAALLDGARIAAVPEGAEVFAPGQPADRMLLLLEGSVRVSQRSQTGREVFLFRVQAGESCVLTTSCMLAFEDYSATGVAETSLRAVEVPRALFDRLLGESGPFRRFVFRAWSRRMSDLFALVDDIVFRRLDVRLAERLLELAEADRVAATHQRLASELGTAREVISRLLAEFQRRGWVAQARGELRLTGRGGLERLARSGAG